jgi:hypothetical protein
MALIPFFPGFSDTNTADLDSREVVRMSVEQRELDVDVDLEENVATATVTEEIAVEDLFVDGQLRL